MSEEQLKAFLEKVQSDARLQEMLIAEANADAIANIAKKEGYSISIDLIRNAQSASELGKMEDVDGG
jgi:predicted ribosomally synthesized peptide with nif11-like leader